MNSSIYDSRKILLMLLCLVLPLHSTPHPFSILCVSTGVWIDKIVAVIDALMGLRGIAIISVVLFHFFPESFCNGYIGVDMFFVLSGYLMAMMMLRYKSIGVSQVVDFIYRRIKRIVPLYYFCTLLILLALSKWAKEQLQRANISPATTALLFITNLVKPKESDDYFEKLGLAVDMFTHTWSLSLEIQYYLFFPIIFIIFRMLPLKIGYLFLLSTSFLSFTFYALADNFTSFNSVFARIWQFNAGTFAFLQTHSNNESELSNEEEFAILEFKQRTKGTSIFYTGNKNTFLEFSIGVNVSLCIFIALTISPQLIYAHFSRITVILLTFLIVQCGTGHYLLENKYLVFIGEISYAWYLIHWPIVAYCRLIRADFSHLDLSAALLVSFLCSIFLHFLLEKHYLNWKKIAIISVISVLIMANSMVIFLMEASLASDEQLGSMAKTDFSTIILKNSFYYPSDFIENITYGYENKTADQRMILNRIFNLLDYRNGLLERDCKKFEKSNNPIERRCLFNEGASKKSKLKLLVIGNSWAATLMSIIHDECKSNFSHLEIVFARACEVFARTTIDRRVDCSKDYFFMDAVKRVKPDVLFIIQRSLNFFKIINGTTPFNDFVFETASSRLEEIQKHVSRRIFILDAFPEFSASISRWLNNYLDNPKLEVNYTAHVSITQNYAVAKVRYTRLVTECPKCKLFDYMPQFFFNGKFYTYDPKYFVSFVTTYRHLTKVGLERVRPIVKNLCKRFTAIAQPNVYMIFMGINSRIMLFAFIMGRNSIIQDNLLNSSGAGYRNSMIENLTIAYF